MIPTAEEFLKNTTMVTEQEISIVKNYMIEFTKLHVENFTKSELELKEYLELHVK